MNPVSSTTLGFRLLFRRPLIPFAEIAWRWTFAAAAWVLGIGFVLEYFDSLPVSKFDQLLLYTGHPFLVAEAFRRIFAGSSFRFVEAGILLSVCLAGAWVLLASVGRLAVLRAVFEEFEWEPKSRNPFPALVFLNFLRASLLLAAKIAAVGSALMASSYWASGHVRAAAMARVVFLGWLLICLAWAVLNWLLSVAEIVVVAEGVDSFAAIAGGVGLLQSQTVAMVSASAVFGALHFVGLAVAAMVVVFLVPVAAAHPITLVIAFAVVLWYSIFADFVYTGRLAAYAFLATGREELPAWMVRPSPVSPAPGDIRAPIDKDELILSDVPAPA